MPDLSQAQVVGGAVVTVSTDTKGLRVGYAEAKTTTAEIDKLESKIKVGATADKASASSAVASVVELVPKSVALPILVDVKAQALDALEKRLASIKTAASTISVRPPALQMAGNEYGIAPGVARQAAKPLRPFDIADRVDAYPLRPAGYASPSLAAAADVGMRPDAYGLTGPDFKPTPRGPLAPYAIEGDLARPTPWGLSSSDPYGSTRSTATASPIGPRNRDGQFEDGASGIGARVKDSVTGMTAALAEFGKTSEQTEKVVKGLSVGLLAIDSATSTIGASLSALSALSASTPEEAAKAIKEGQAAIESIPVAGGLISRLGQTAYSGISSLANYSVGNEFESDQGYAARTLDAAAKADAKTAKKTAKLDADKSFRPVSEANELALVVSKMDAQDKEVATLVAQRKQLVEKINAAGTTGMASSRAALASTDAVIADAMKRADASRNFGDAIETSRNLATYSGGSIARMQGSGRSDAAGRAAIKESTRSQVDELEAERQQLIATGSDPRRQNQIADKLRAVKQAGYDQLAGYEEELERNRQDVIRGSRANADQIRLRGQGKVEQADDIAIRETYRPRIEAARRNNDTQTSAALQDEQQAQLDDRRRQRAVQTGSAIEAADAATVAARLRIQGDGNAAELTLYDAAVRGRLESLKRAGADAKQMNSEMARAAAERTEIVKRQEAATTQAVESAGASATASRLRMAGEGQKAELVLFDAAIKARLDSLRQNGADQKQIDAEAAAGAQQRAEIVRNQERQRAQFSQSMTTRRDQAAAAGEGMTELSALLGTLSSMKAELNDPSLSKDQRSELAKTQRAELQSMQSQIFAPNRYAEELDRNRTAIGGPGGNAGKEDIALLTKIAEALANIDRATQNGGGLGP